MRVISIVFLGLLLQLPFLATKISLTLQRFETRKIAKELIYEGLQESELIAIHSREFGNQLHWEKEHEFEFRGMLYDIVRTETCGGDTIYYCWIDHAESRVKKKLNSLHNQFLEQNPVRQDQQSKTWSFYQQLYFEFYQETVPAKLPDHARSLQTFIWKDNRLSGWFNSPFTPPDIQAFPGWVGLHTQA